MNPAVMSAVARTQRGPVLLKLAAGTDPRAAGWVCTGDAHRSYIDAAGVVRYPPVNRPMYAARVFDASGVARIVWLMQAAGTNKWFATEDLSNGSAWHHPTQVLITANATASPDGNVTADKIIQGTAVADNYLYQPQDLTAGSPVTWSLFAKAAGYQWLRCSFEFSNGTKNNWIDTQNGVFGTVAAGVSARVIPCANGWNRYVMTATPTLTEAARPMTTRIVRSDADTASWAGDGVSGVYGWGYQFEASSYASSYIPNATLAAITRVAETAHLDLPFSAQPLTAYLKFVDLGASAMAANQRYIEFGSGTTSGRFLLENGYTCYYEHDGHVSSEGAGSPPAAFGDQVEFAGLLYPDGSTGVQVAFNGGPAFTGRNLNGFGITPFSSNRLTFGLPGSTVPSLGLEELIIASSVRDFSYLRSL